MKQTMYRFLLILFCLLSIEAFAVDDAKINPEKLNILCSFHDAFDYFARDFNFKVVDVIEVVPGQEPSAGELTKLAKRIKALKAKAIFSEPQYPEKIALLLSKETGVSA